MGQLLLCSHEPASIPYYMEAAALNIYSLEELCFYLLRETDTFGISFLDDELIEWIQNELKLPALAKRLQKQKAEGGGLAEFVSLLVSGCNYCTPQEVETLKEFLGAFEDKSEVECKKIRIDRLLARKRYRICIAEYTRLLYTPGVDGAFAGDIYHNLGTAYAGLFFFSEAAECYQKAYQRNQNPLSQKQQEAALRLAKGENGSQEAVVGEMAERPQEVLGQWKEAYNNSVQTHPYDSGEPSMPMQCR